MLKIHNKENTNVAVFRKSGEVLTTSLDISEKFGKSHKHVLDAIRNLDCSEEFSRTNFRLSNYEARGKSYPCFDITRDGFSLLAMGFKGKKATTWKVYYIIAFNKLEEALKRQIEPTYIEAREKGKLIRRSQTNAIQDFLEYARLSGSKNPEKYYMIFTKMQNSLLFIINKAKSDNVRDLLNTEQLFQIGTSDQLIAKTIREGIKLETPYKDIYKAAKRKVQAFADLIGVSEVPSCSSLMGHNSRNAIEEDATEKEEEAATSPSHA